ncbi:MAG: TFIIB-type zinc ribbon-containing protein [Candidatus Helarchaeota archaeon]
MVQEVKNYKSCHECGSSICFDHKSGNTICSGCGLIIHSNLLQSSQNFFDVYFNNKNINGFPTSNTIKDPDLMRRFNLKTLEELNLKYKFRRLIKLQKQSNFKKGRSPNLLRGLQEIKRICGNLELSHQIEEESALIFRKIDQLKIIKGRSTLKLSVCCVYLALKSRKYQMTLEEMVSRCEILSTRELSRLCRFLAEKINLRISSYEPTALLLRIINNGNFPEELLGYSIKILKKVKNSTDFQGKSPISIAAAAIYIAGKNHKLKISQEKIAQAAKISRKSISIRAKELRKLLLEN